MNEKEIGIIINELDDLLNIITGEENQEIITARMEKLDEELIILRRRRNSWFYWKWMGWW